MIEIIDAVMTAASLTDNYAMQGEYFEILEAQYPIDVYLLDRSGVQISVMKRSEASFFARPGRFEHIRIESTQPQIVRFMVGSGDVGTRRISSQVQVVDGEKARAIAGAAHMCTLYQVVTASEQAAVQLWNPAGSGKRLVIGQIRAASESAQGIIGSFTNAALTTNVSAQRIASRLSGSAASIAQARTQFGTPIVAQPIVLNFTVQASQEQIFIPKGAPLIVTPGWGLTLQTTVAGTSVTGVMEYFEEVI